MIIYVLKEKISFNYPSFSHINLNNIVYCMHAIFIVTTHKYLQRVSCREVYVLHTYSLCTMSWAYLFLEIRWSPLELKSRKKKHWCLVDIWWRDLQPMKLMICFLSGIVKSKIWRRCCCWRRWCAPLSDDVFVDLEIIVDVSFPKLFFISIFLDEQLILNSIWKSRLINIETYICPDTY